MKSQLETISLDSLSLVTGGVYWSQRTHQLWNEYYRAPASANKLQLLQKYQRSADQGLLGTIFNPVK